MLGFRMAFGAACAALVLGATFGCGGSVEKDGSVAQAGAGDAGTTGQSGGASGGAHAGRGGAGMAGSNTTQAGRPIVDPDPVDTGCPDRDPPPPMLECDPFGPNTCAAGLGCYPFIEHPEGNGCESQRYGTVCAPAGSRVQGEICGDLSGGCAPGFVCVVGQLAGKRCAALCELGKPNACSGGLLCGDLDVAGFGACG
jgi:hypothetical protein